MNKHQWLIATAIGLALAGSASAATISNINGQSCGDFNGAWHFVNNQTGGAGAGSFNATWSSGDTCTVGPSKVLGNTQHFDCVASGTLISASTNLPGRLVLSDFSCETKCDDPKYCPK